MPELPEVESIKIQLEKFLIGHVVRDIEIRYKKCFEGNKKRVEGNEIKKIRRFGKVLLIDLMSSALFLVRLRVF